MKDLLIIIAGTVVFLPCLLIVSESETFWPNLSGFVYAGILFLVGRTKVGKTASRCLYKACINIEGYLFGRNGKD